MDIKLGICRAGVAIERQDDPETTAPPDLAVQPDPPLMQQRNRAHQGQAQARATPRPGGIGPVEALKNLLAVFRRNARPGVLHLKPRRVGLPGQPQVNLAADRRVFQRIFA